MARSVKVASRDDILEGSCKVVEVDGAKIALFNYGGQFYAIANACLHQGGSLGEGDVYGSRVACPLHGWVYDFTTGRSVDDPSLMLDCYNVQRDGDQILVEVQQGTRQAYGSRSL